ncbi:hypothetical protein SteCoe_7231 [Stentor coeruleus]|uniref:LNR domain-containing protein n=1 Tax=Stentor coeruleus TaxID=5963 RepID=A0A1R2CN22_9CILI|nr:hypothetical protein SteCoe_7231 [Stentor coeruleus]
MFFMTLSTLTLAYEYVPYKYFNCITYWIGDLHCDSACNNKYCNYDSSYSGPDSFKHSDCYEDCLSTECDISLLGNGECNEECNNQSCGWDLEDCGFVCNYGCRENMLGDGNCDPSCNVIECKYDMNDCGWCDIGCFKESLSLEKECIPQCNKTESRCFYENNNPCFPPCAEGCPTYLINDGYCDSACNNEACGYDGNDCKCGPGCTDKFMNSEDCEENPCNILGCNFKNYQCGYCAPGCFEVNLSDGICQEKCNNPECNYDYFDCSCAHGCTMLYENGTWTREAENSNNPYCLVPECEFNLAGNYSSFERKEYLLNQLINKNWSLIELPEGSCSNLADYENVSCEIGNECDNPESFYCMGNANPIANCLRGNGTNCFVCSGVMVMGVCANSIKKCPNGYINNTILDNLFSMNGSAPIFCYREIDKYSRQNPKRLYVAPADIPIIEGNGSVENPYKSLYYAFTEIYARYTEIVLQTGTHVFEKDLINIYHLIKDKNDPLNIEGFTEFIELTIKGESEEEPSVVVWKGMLRISPKAYTVYIKNIKFLGTSILRNDCTGDFDFCYYCPFIGGTNIHYDDKYNEIPENDYNLIPKNCSLYSSHVLFSFTNSAYFSNVAFYGFRHQFQTLIDAKCDLSFERFYFEKIQAKPGGEVIRFTCNTNCQENTLMLKDGIITDLNYGYEITDIISLGNFLTAESFGSAIFENIDFKYNLALYYLNSDYKSYLLSFKNFIGALRFSNCVFDTNFVDILIKVDVTDLIYNDLKPDIFGLSQAYNQVHFTIENSKFYNIYSSTNFISYYMKSIIHNIYITNITIDNVHSGATGIIYICNSAKLKDKDKEGEIITIRNGSTATRVYIPLRYISLVNITIENSSSGMFAIYVNSMPYVYVTYIKISNVKDGSSESLHSIIDLFATNQKYLSIYPEDIQLESLSCFGISLFISCNFINMTYIEIFDTSCYSTSSSSGLEFELTLSMLYLENIYIHDINSRSTNGIALSIHLTILELHIISLNLYNIYNELSNVIELLKNERIYIYEMHINLIASNSLSPFLITNPFILELQNFIINNSSSYTGSGGCLEIKTSALHPLSNITLQNGTFNSCSAEKAYGGAIYLDSLGTGRTQKIIIQDIIFKNSIAKSGSLIYITNKIAFESGSIFKNWIADECIAYLGAMIYDTHLEGILSIHDIKFSSSNATFAGIDGSYTYSNQVLDIQNFTVENFIGCENVFNFRSQVDETKIVMKDIFIYKNWDSKYNSYSGSFFITKIILIAENVNINEMSSIIQADGQSSVYFKDSKFMNLHASGVVITDKSLFFCIYCSFEYIAGTLISATLRSYIAIDFSILQYNYGEPSGPSMIYINSDKQRRINFTNTIITENTAEIGDFIQFTNSSIYFDNCTVSKNSAASSVSLIFNVLSSKLEILNSNFNDQKSLSNGGFIYSVLSEFINITNTNFTNGTADYGGAFYLKESNLSINFCHFSSMQANFIGSTIWALDTPISINNSEFENCQAKTGLAIYMQSKKLYIESSTFTDIGSTLDNVVSGMIDLSGDSSLIVLDSEFSDSINSGFAILVKNATDVNINESIFMNITSYENGAVTVFGGENKGEVQITRSKFINNNSSGKGAALYIKNIGLFVEDCYVHNNFAKEDGGGFFMATPNCATCDFVISGNTEFSENSCNLTGGAIHWEDYKPSIGDSVIMFNNSAAYGENLSSKPATITYKKNFRNFRNLEDDIIITDAAPGQSYSEVLEIYILDTYGEIITTDSINELEIKTIDNDSKFILSGITTFKASNGKFTVTQFIPMAEPGSTKTIIASTSGIETVQVRNDDTNYKNYLTIKISFRNCTYGEQIFETSCKACVETKFLINPKASCNACPTGGICAGGSALVPKKGYWRSSNFSEIIYPCIFAEVCLGNTSESDWQGTCNTGYTGVKCGSCLGGYSKNNKGLCSLCPDQARNAFFLSLICLSVIFVCVVLYKSSIKSAFAPTSKHSIYIKIFTNYLQLVFLTIQFDLKWPSYAVSFFGVQKTAATATESIFSVDCYISTKNTGNPENSYYYKILLLAVAPLIIIAVSILVWFGISTIKMTNAYMKRELFLTIIVIFFLIYPNVVKFMFSHFSCESIDMIKSYLRDDYNIECWTEKYNRYSLIIVLPSIVIWVLGMPTLLLIIMIKKRMQLKKNHNRIIFGFLFNGYKSSRFYWEFVIMYRKILIICIIVFVRRVSISVQGLTATIILLLSLFIQYKLRPYNSYELNHMEIEALTTASLTIYCGLYYLTEDIDDGLKMFLFLIIIIGNLYFIIFWTYWMLAAILEMIIKIFPSLKFILKKGDAFDEDFNSEELKVQGSFINNDDLKRAYTFIQKSSEKVNYFSINNIQELYMHALKYDKDVKSDDENKEISERVFRKKFVKLYDTSFAFNETIFCTEESSEKITDRFQHEVDTPDKKNKNFLNESKQLNHAC